MRLRFAAPFFKEFTLQLPKSPERVVKRLAKDRILAGVPLKPLRPRSYKDCLLVAVTEKRTKDEIDAYAGRPGRGGGLRPPCTTASAAYDKLIFELSSPGPLRLLAARVRRARGRPRRARCRRRTCARPPAELPEVSEVDVDPPLLAPVAR